MEQKEEKITDEWDMALISDIHSNLEALTAVLDKINELGIKEVYCLGDVAGYGPDPVECLKLLFERNIPSLIGNHDFALRTSRIKDFFFPLHLNEFAKKSLFQNQTMIRRECPELLSRVKGEFRHYFDKKMIHNDGTDSYFYAVHGFPVSIQSSGKYKNKDWRAYCFKLMDLSSACKIIEKNIGHDIDIIAVGHTHSPDFLIKEGRIFVNPGSVGQTRDNDWRASFCVVNLHDKGYKDMGPSYEAEKNVKIMRVEYDLEKTIRKILDRKLPAFNAARLDYHTYRLVRWPRETEPKVS